MALDAKLVGNSGLPVEVTADNAMRVVTELEATAYPEKVGGIKVYSEVDDGVYTGSPRLLSPETDVDYRMRVATDILLDDEVFQYASQNTTKYRTNVTTQTIGYSSGSATLNSGNNTANSTFAQLITYRGFHLSTTNTLSMDTRIAFDGVPNSGNSMEFGLINPDSASAQNAIVDGVFVRYAQGELRFVASYNTVEQSVLVPFLPVNGEFVQYIIYVNNNEASLWIGTGDSVSLAARLECQDGNNTLVQSYTLSPAFRTRNLAAGTINLCKLRVGRYSIRLGGTNISTTMSTQGNRVFGSYQTGPGISPQGGLANYGGAYSSGSYADPTAAVPAPGTAVASGLGGRIRETATLVIATDGILQSYQVPAYAAASTGRTLVVRGLYLTTTVQSTLTGGPCVAEYFLAFGHTSAALTTGSGADAVSSKHPRRIYLPFTQVYGANQAASTLVQQATYFCDFGDAPIYVNQGEYIALCKRHTGTVPTAGVLQHIVTYVYGWE